MLILRGSPHDASIREYTIDSGGMHLGERFRATSGILSGNITHREDDAEAAQEAAD